MLIDQREFNSVSVPAGADMSSHCSRLLGVIHILVKEFDRRKDQKLNFIEKLLSYCGENSLSLSLSLSLSFYFSFRLVQLFPHRHLGDLGQHDDGQPVERLCISPDKQTVMSCSHDQTVRFWQVSALLGTTSKDSDEESDDDSDDSDSDDDCSARRKRKKLSGKRGLKRAAKCTTNDFFADL